jgi:hypothetical protein
LLISSLESCDVLKGEHKVEEAVADVLTSPWGITPVCGKLGEACIDDEFSAFRVFISSHARTIIASHRNYFEVSPVIALSA